MMSRLPLQTDLDIEVVDKADAVSKRAGAPQFLPSH